MVRHRRAKEREEDRQMIYRMLKRNPNGLTRPQLTEMTGLTWEAIRHMALNDPKIRHVKESHCRTLYFLKEEIENEIAE